MFYPKKLIVPVFVCAVLAGVGLHFLYARFPCTLSALLSPVCESLWEHIKILYWPYLAASAFLAWGRQPVRPWLLSLVILCPLCWSWACCSMRRSPSTPCGWTSPCIWG